MIKPISERISHLRQQIKALDEKLKAGEYDGMEVIYQDIYCALSARIEMLEEVDRARKNA